MAPDDRPVNDSFPMCGWFSDVQYFSRLRTVVQFAVGTAHEIVAFPGGWCAYHSLGGEHGGDMRSLPGSRVYQCWAIICSWLIIT